MLSLRTQEGLDLSAASAEAAKLLRGVYEALRPWEEPWIGHLGGCNSRIFTIDFHEFLKNFSWILIVFVFFRGFLVVKRRLHLP